MHRVFPQTPVRVKSVLSSQFSVLSSQFSVLSSQFSVLSSQFSVLSSQFSVLISQFSVLRSQFSGLSFRFSTHASVARCRGDPVFSRIPFHLLSHHIHFFFQRRKTLQHLMNAQRHVANGFNLRPSLCRQAARFDQQQIGIPQQRSERIVQSVAHLQHVAAEHGLAFE